MVIMTVLELGSRLETYRSCKAASLHVSSCTTCIYRYEESGLQELFGQDADDETD